MLRLTKNPRVFWFHYNKPMSKKTGKPKISIHYDKTCYIVDDLVIETRTYSHINKRQPYFVMKGQCTRFEVKNDIAYIS